MKPEEYAALAGDAKPLDTDTNYKAVAWIETYTGRAFWPLEPKVEALSVIDIAHALSNQCRYSGHVRFFYSVAQHCCLLADHVANNGGSALDALQILMHDSPEAYLVDVPRPVKQFMPQYRVWDHGINECIREWMGWKGIPIPSFQDDLDSRIIVDERAALMPNSGNDWGHRLEPVGVTIQPWLPVSAKRQFLMQYAAYAKEVYGSHQYLNEEWGISGDVVSYVPTSSDHAVVADVVEVDFRGGVARIKVRGDDGILTRDRSAGMMPRAETKWHHGKFTLQERAA